MSIAGNVEMRASRVKSVLRAFVVTLVRALLQIDVRNPVLTFETTVNTAAAVTRVVQAMKYVQGASAGLNAWSRAQTGAAPFVPTV